MTIPNRIVLDDLAVMPIGEVVAMPPDQLMLLQQEVADQLRQAKAIADRLDAALAQKYAERAQIARQAAGKDTGTVRFEDGPITIVADVPKRVVWDQQMLAQLVERIRASGDDPNDYIDAAYKVPERKFSAWPPAIRDTFLPARTVRPGKQCISLIPVGKD